MKLLVSHEDNGGNLAERFLREARAMAKMRHPGIVSAYDIETHNGQPFITMDFVDGVSLKKYIKTNHLTSRQITTRNEVVMNIG